LSRRSTLLETRAESQTRRIFEISDKGLSYDVKNNAARAEMSLIFLCDFASRAGENSFPLEKQRRKEKNKEYF